MTDDMIPVPRALIERIGATSADDRDESVIYELLDLIPKPPAPRLRMVVDLNELRNIQREQYPVMEIGRLVERLEAQPDVLTVIERVVRKWLAAELTERGSLMARITAALTEGDPQ